MLQKSLTSTIISRSINLIYTIVNEYTSYVEVYKNNTKKHISIQYMLLFKYDNVAFKYIFGIIYEFIIIYQHKIKIFLLFYRKYVAILFI